MIDCVELTFSYIYSFFLDFFVWPSAESKIKEKVIKIVVFFLENCIKIRATIIPVRDRPAMTDKWLYSVFMLLHPELQKTVSVACKV